MQFTITRHGVPLGQVELRHTQAVHIVDFRPLPGYAAVSAVVSGAVRAMRGDVFGIGPSTSVEEAALAQAVSAWRALNADLELRDEEGGLVPTTALELLEDEEHSPFWRWSATIAFLESAAGVPARYPRRSADGDASSDVPAP